MANSPQAKKRASQAEKARQRNMGQRSMMRTYMKRVVKAVEAGDKEAAQEAYKTAAPIIDKMAGRGIIHRNKAARHKSRLNEKVRAL